MKRVIVIAAILASVMLTAKEITVVVDREYIDLYKLPIESSRRIRHFFKKGQVLHVKSCNKAGWCELKRGYVKKRYLRFVDAKKPHYTTLKKTPVPKKEIKSQLSENIDLKLYDPKPLEHNETKPTLQKRIVTYERNATAYERYFDIRSAKLIFTK